jgi:hypothetical protein
MHESGSGTELPISNVRFHGGYQGHNGHVADIAKTALMTQLRHWRANFAVTHNAALW